MFPYLKVLTWCINIKKYWRRVYKLLLESSTQQESVSEYFSTVTYVRRQMEVTGRWEPLLRILEKSFKLLCEICPFKWRCSIIPQQCRLWGWRHRRAYTYRLTVQEARNDRVSWTQVQGHPCQHSDIITNKAKPHWRDLIPSYYCYIRVCVRMCV